MASPTTSSISNPSIAIPDRRPPRHAAHAPPSCTSFPVSPKPTSWPPSPSPAPPSLASSNATASTAKTPSSRRAAVVDVPSSTPRWPPRRPSCSLPGSSGSACARHLGIPASTFNENRRCRRHRSTATRVPAAGADAAPAVAADRSPRQRRRSRRPTRLKPCHRSRHSRRIRDQHAPSGPRGARRRAPHACQRRNLMTEATSARSPSQLTPSLAAASSRRCRCCCARACSAPPTAWDAACPPDSTALTHHPPVASPA